MTLAENPDQRWCVSHLPLVMRCKQTLESSWNSSCISL